MRTQSIPSLDFNAGIGAAEMLGRANYIALVGGGRQPKFPQNKVIIWDDAKQQAVITLEFRSQVQHVSLSRSRIIAVLHNSVHTYAFSSPPEKLSVFETADNPLGLCCLVGGNGYRKRQHYPCARNALESNGNEPRWGDTSYSQRDCAPPLQIPFSPSYKPSESLTSTKGTLIRLFSTTNCARISELRRGVDHACIYSLAISPNSTLLAVTSDKSTLHIFDLPHSHHPYSPPTKPYTSKTSSLKNHQNQRSSSPYSITSSDAALSDTTTNPNPNPTNNNNHKWGLLGKIPLLPRVFSDTYSFASAHISIDDDPDEGGGRGGSRPIPGLQGGKARKGVIGWVNDWTILVLGAGRDGRWEKFVLGETETTSQGEVEGRRVLVRRGWKRYLGG
ncbi:MAG: hypothetical protein Q9190_002673 [Brigantiaea leucoxantha]